MYSEKSIKNILRLNKNAKFIIMLRDPLDASKSMFKKRLSVGYKPLREVDLNFYKCWEILEKRKKGFGYPNNCRNKILFRYDVLYSYDKYVHYINKHIKPHNRIYINFKTLSNNPNKLIKYVFNFLNIDPVSIPIVKQNSGTIIKNNKLIFIIDYILQKTTSIRHKYNLAGNKFLKIKSLYQSFKNKKQEHMFIEDKRDEEIKFFFSKAYEALNKECNI